MNSTLDGVRILVTGAGGMIGRAVVTRLHADGAAVTAHIGPPGTAQPDQPPLPQGVVSHWCDVLDIGPLVAGHDVVVHLAGPPGVAASFANPERYLRDHVLGAAAVLAALGPARLVHISSAEVYGRPRSQPVDETAVAEPLSPYGAAKLGAEALVRSLRPDATILRPFSIYGPHSPPHSLIGSLLRQARLEGGIELASLRPVRDYVHIGDLARLISTCVESAPVGTFNVCSGQGVSVGELAHLALAVIGRDVPVVEIGSDRPADIAELVGDPSRAAAELGWTAQVDLVHGLKQCLEEISAESPDNSSPLFSDAPAQPRT